MAHRVGFERCPERPVNSRLRTLEFQCPVQHPLGPKCLQVHESLENAPQAFMGLLQGKNFGKLVVRVSPDPTR